jgi:antitoxin component of RelBE/YafQ-DinJ toxin-antitoxin module
MSNKTSTIQIRLQDDLKDKFKLIADANNMSISEYIRFLIMYEVRKNEEKKEENK